LIELTRAASALEEFLHDTSRAIDRQDQQSSWRNVSRVAQKIMKSIGILTMCPTPSQNAQVFQARLNTLAPSKNAIL
jgi:hypothetical protein